MIHYSADARESIFYIYNENNYIHRGVLEPGEVAGFFAPMFPAPDSWIDVSAPMSNTGVEIAPPFSLVDVYIDASAKLCAEKKYGFFERFRRGSLMRTGDPCTPKDTGKPHECRCTPESPTYIPKPPVGH